MKMFEPFNDQCPSHIETSQLISSANQLTGFFVRGTLIVKGLNVSKSLFCIRSLMVFILDFHFGQLLSRTAFYQVLTGQTVSLLSFCVLLTPLQLYYFNFSSFISSLIFFSSLFCITT